MMKLDLTNVDVVGPADSNIAVYKLKTKYYAKSNGSGFGMKKVLTKRLKLSKGLDLLEEEFCNLGVEALSNIVNLSTADDGLYIVSLTEVTQDWETGHVDDYLLMLVPHVPAKKEQNNV